MDFNLFTCGFIPLVLLVAGLGAKQPIFMIAYLVYGMVIFANDGIGVFIAAQAMCLVPLIILGIAVGLVKSAT